MHDLYIKTEPVRPNGVWTKAQLEAYGRLYQRHGMPIYAGSTSRVVLSLLDADEQADFLNAIIGRSGLTDAYTAVDNDLPCVTPAAIEAGELSPALFLNTLEGLYDGQ